MNKLFTLYHHCLSAQPFPPFSWFRPSVSELDS